ncbi:unnamed protein product [marine sediment metagenome]|uniref:N-acetyltransferase domain-containing protein n=1 Tax=marine sediment metagenome TaxID=412755 RepID=X0Z3P5_9ZZZZ
MRFANEYGYGELNNFPGCNQLTVSNHAFIFPKDRGKGNGSENHKLRLKRAKSLGYDYIMCTVIHTNTPELRILKKNNWKELDRFKNKESGNTVIIFGKKL